MVDATPAPAGALARATEAMLAARAAGAALIASLAKAVPKIRRLNASPRRLRSKRNFCRARFTRIRAASLTASSSHLPERKSRCSKNRRTMAARSSDRPKREGSPRKYSEEFPGRPANRGEQMNRIL